MMSGLRDFDEAKRFLGSIVDGGAKSWINPSSLSEDADGDGEYVVPSWSEEETP
jgi:hypothetical protein